MCKSLFENPKDSRHEFVVKVNIRKGVEVKAYLFMTNTSNKNHGQLRERPKNKNIKKKIILFRRPKDQIKIATYLI